MVEPFHHIDIHSLTLDELSGVVNLYPWYAAARLELCRRMFSMGENAWTEEEFAAQVFACCRRLRQLRHSPHIKIKRTVPLQVNLRDTVLIIFLRCSLLACQ